VGEKDDKYEDEELIRENRRKETVLRFGLRYYDNIKMNLKKYDEVK
jgi:hypothetical protein